MSSIIKNSLIAGALIITALLGYYLFVIRDTSVISDTDNLVSAQSEIETQEFLRRLNELKTIELSGTVFTDERFQSLEDNSRPVPSSPIGRANPFAPAF